LAIYEASLSNYLALVNGTEAYVPREQRQGHKSWRAVDVFAMGYIFIQLLTFSKDISIRFFQEVRKYHGSGTGISCPIYGTDITCKLSVSLY